MAGLESPRTAQEKPLWESKRPPCPRTPSDPDLESVDSIMLEKACLINTLDYVLCRREKACHFSLCGVRT